MVKITALFLLVTLHCATDVTAARSLVLHGAESYRLGGPNLEILEDKSGKLTIADVTSPSRSGAFISSRQAVPNFGITDSAFWLRFTLSADRIRPMLLFLEHPLMSEADMYLPDDRGGYAVMGAGAALPMRLHPIPGREILFPLTITATPRTYYLRTHVAGRAQMPLTLVTENAMRERQSVMGYLIGGYVGAMLLLSLISLALFFVIREQSFLYYALYAVAVLATQLMLYGYLKIWRLPIHPSSLDSLQILIANAALLIGTQFTRGFLMTKRHAPRFDIILKLLLVYHLVSFSFPWLAPMTICKQLLFVVILLVPLVVIAAAIDCYRKGFTAARYFLMARLSLYIGGVAFALANMGILPVNIVTGNIFLFATLLDALLIAVAMGDRYREINLQNRSLFTDLRREIGERTTADRALETQLTVRRQLERDIVRISDEERRRISRELHDGLCQKLTSARLYCSMAINSRNKMEGVLTLLEPLGKLLQESVDDAYTLSKGLWPLEHDPQGKSPSLADMADRLSAESGMAIKYFQHGAIESAPAAVLTQLYRIAQEAIVNAVKHSGADLVTVSLRMTDAGQIVLSVQDNGLGIVEGAETPGGMGMSIMKHRAGIIGGELEIRSNAAEGSRIICCAPGAAQGGEHGGA